MAHFATVWQVDVDLNAYDEDSISHLEINEDHEGVQKLAAWNLVSNYWSGPSPYGRLDIFVKLPTASE